MNSMTGYGRASAALGNQTLTVQVNSVNRRGLDLTMKVPDEWQALEPAIGDAVRKQVQRGKVHVAVEVAGQGQGSTEWDPAVLGAALDQLTKFAKSKHISFEVTGELLWQIASSQRSGAKLPADDETGALLLATLGQALRGLGAMRAKEGEALLVDFLGRLEKLHAGVEAVAQR